MLATYRYLGYTVAVLVIVQLASIAWMAFGVTAYNDDRNLPKGMLPDEGSGYGGDVGFAIHSVVGNVVLPLVALLLLLAGFLAKFRGSWQIALGILVAVILQVVLAVVSYAAPVVGILHALNALGIMAMGVQAGRRAEAASAAVAA